ncbi:hypothetical protein VF21_06739 [Pseudogymnoascus sp. 05NY08]|nr:hypothetical protein VF21_06739 [Pseudogymnoascus sp. 05NY08]
MALWLHSKWGTTPINTRNYRAVRVRETSAPQWNQLGNPEDGLLGNSDGSEINDHDLRASQWLYNSDRWNKGFPKGWEAISVLGAGGFGIAGHWRYVAEGPHKMGYVQGEIHDIVVKQANASSNKGLISEAFIMEMLTRTGSRHFPQIYGRVHRDVGHQDRVAVDRKRREVHRIFMEFCAGGSLGKHVNDSYYLNLPTPEAKLWSWLHCFAKAIMAMERGHEMESDTRVSQRQPWGHNRGVVHFDIKPDNALITVTDKNEHMGAERVVISDFGISEVLPNEWNGPHRDHDKTLNEFEDVGTVIFRAPEQQGVLPRPMRKYGACTNIFQIGCLMYCLILQVTNFPGATPPTYTALTGQNNRHSTRGGQDLEVADYLSKTLRGLVAECLFMDPANRPTAVQLLRRTRAGLARASPWEATASKLYEKLTPVNNLMLDRWFEKIPGVIWPKIIPEMEEVVNLRIRQLHQVDNAKKYVPKQGAGGQNPPPTGNQGSNLPGGPAGRQNPPGAPPVAGPSGTAGAQPPPTRPEAVVRNKPWPGEKFTQPIDIINVKGPRRAKPPPAGNVPPKEPDWGKVVNNIKRLPPVNVPRPQKRPSNEKGPDPKRARQTPLPLLRQIYMMGKWLKAIDLNDAPAPVPKPPVAEKTFIIPVRIWPGPRPVPTDDAYAYMRTFTIHISATLADLLKVMKKESRTVAFAIRCTFARGGMTTELPMNTTLAKLGYGPATRVRSPHLECFRTIFEPMPYGPGGVPWSFNLVVFMPTQYDQSDTTIPRLTLKAGFQMTIREIKQVIIDSDMYWYFRSPSQMRIYCGGSDPQAHDCPDYRAIMSFFKEDAQSLSFREGELVRLCCVFRKVGKGGSGSGRVTGFNRVYTPPRYRNNRRFL